MFFAKSGKYEACGLFGKEHFILLSITIISEFIALYYTKNETKDEVYKIVKRVTVCLWILEIIKIIFNFATGNISNPGSYIPLYYCSLILYAGLFSSYGKDKIKRIGDVFIATGGIVGGICFLICPNTSLTIYPGFHYISIQSFVFHGAMLYLGILVNITNYVELGKKDILYYSCFIIIVGIIAYIFNYLFDCNLMFVSKNYPNTPVELIYRLSGNLFPAIMILGQAILPFKIVYKIRNLYLKRNISEEMVLSN